MKVIVFGATGGTGRQFVKECLSQGLDTSVFVRNTAAARDMGDVTVYEGDAYSKADVIRAVQGHDAVLSALGGNPTKENKARSQGTKNIIDAMKEAGVTRLISVSSLGVSESRMMPPWYIRMILVGYIAKHGFVDHELQENHIRESGLDWTIVRPSHLTNGKQTGKYLHGFSQVDLDVKLKQKISRADIAHFSVKQLTDVSYMQQAVGVSC